MIYFVSDVHLGFEAREKDRIREDKFIEFLRFSAEKCQKLYLVGDIFDYWFDYDTVIPKYFYRTLAALSELRKKIPIEYVMGNHDFGHKGFFEDELKIPVHSDDIIREHRRKRFLISHGDGKDPFDKGYLLLKKIMRSQVSLALYLKLHPNLGIKLASGSSKKSRDFTSKKNYGDFDAMRHFAEVKIMEGFDYVIMGHRHTAEIKSVGHGFYVNLGEWLRHPHFGVYDGDSFDLISLGEFSK